MNYLTPREQYCESCSTPFSPELQRIRKETYFKAEMPQMQLGWSEVSLLKWIVRLTQAQQILEIGTFTGLSALAMAEEIVDGQVITIDRDPKHTRLAKEWWSYSSHASKIEQRLGNATDILKQMQDQKERFDLIFVDADKENYLNYFELTFGLLKPGGLLVSDNVLWGDRVLDVNENSDKQTQALVRYAKVLNEESRVRQLMLPLGDGLLLTQKI